VIDDDEATCQFVGAIIKQVLDTDVMMFTDPERAFEFFKQEHVPNGSKCVDAILCDFQMPEMSGHDFVIELRSLGIDTPVIFLSGHINEGTLKQALRLGAFDVIAKPPSKSEVTRTIEVAAQVGAKMGENVLLLHQIKRLSTLDGETAEAKSLIQSAVEQIQKNQRLICLLALRNYASKID